MYVWARQPVQHRLNHNRVRGSSHCLQQHQQLEGCYHLCVCEAKRKPTDCVFSLRVTRCGRWCPNGEGSSLHSCAYACCPCFLCQLASVPLRRVRGSALVIIPQVTTSREMFHPFEVMGVGLLSTGCWLGVSRSHRVCCTTSTSALSVAALSLRQHGPIGDPLL